ncbi:MAG: PAS domain S-box protein [Salinivirgaceae bacterium]|nr:PAS domain S-box protein [Salinivirgaceae bacterium]
MDKEINILFIDDSIDDVEILKLEIQKEGYTIVGDIAKTDEEIKRLQINSYDIIILDYTLHSFSALNVLKILKKQNNQTPIIVVSNAQISDVSPEIFQLGANDFINKNKLNRLVYSIEREIEQQKHRQELTKLKLEFESHQQVLDEQNQLINQLIEATSNPIFYKNKKGIYLGCNQAFANFIGRKKEDIIGKTVYDISPKELADKYRQQDDAFFENPITQRYEHKVQHADGQLMDVVFFKNPIINGNGKIIGLVGHMLNITDIKNAEKKLEESEKRYRFFSDITTEGIVIHEGMIALDMNKSFEKMLEYSREEILNRSLFDFIPFKDDHELILKNVALNKNKPYQIRIKTKQNKIKTVEVEARDLKIEETNNRVVVVRDVTKQIEFEKEISQSQKKYQKLINDMHEGMGITDLDENIVFANPAFHKMFGYKDGELLGFNLKKLIPNNELVKIHKETKSRKDGNSSTYNVNIKRKDGADRIISVSASPYYNENNIVSGTIALFIDVTQQVKFNTDLSKRYEFEKKIFDISSRFLSSEDFDHKVNASLADLGLLTNADRVYILLIDNKYKTFSVSNEWCNTGVIKITPNYQNHPINVVEWGLNMLAKREQIYIKDINTLSEAAYALKEYFIKNEVSSFIGFPIFVGHDLAGIIGVSNPQKIRDYSNNEFLLLRNAGEVLSNAIQRKLAEDRIGNLNDKLLLKNKELEQVLYVTSHDIRSPLVNIVGFTRELSKAIDELNELIVKEEITPEDKENINYLINEDIPEILKFINAGGVKMDRLLYGLLKLSRLGRTVIESSDVNLNNLFSEILESFEFQIQSNKIEIKIDKFPILKTDRNLISQVLSNLIDNAVKYFDEAKKSYIKIKHQLTTHDYLIIIEDNGVGIPEDNKDTVFEIFNRLKPDMAEGEGLGLTIIKKGVERLGGTINLESKEGVGCKFIITFPLKQ